MEDNNNINNEINTEFNEENKAETNQLVEEEKTPDEQSKKPNNNKIWTIILAIAIVIGLAGYLIWDNLIKEDENKNQGNPAAETDENTSDTNIINKTINGKNVKIEFKYLTKNDGIDVDIYMNDTKVLHEFVSASPVMGVWCETEEEIVETDEMSSEDKESCLKWTKEHINKNNVKTIKGDDKEYIVIDYYKDNFKITILNDSGTILYDDNPIDSYMNDGFVLEESCVNYDKFVVGKNKVQQVYSISNDGIYYLNKTAGYQISEYKMTVNKDNVTATKIATCLGWTSAHGGDVDSVSYVITKTQKVNNKNVNLEYRFVIPYADDLENFDELEADYIATADLYIDNKLIVKGVYVDELETNEENYRKMTALDVDDNIAYASNHWKKISTELDKTFGVIKGDKNYLFIKSYTQSPAGSGSMIYVLNSSNTPIFSSTIILAGGGLAIDKLCPNLNLFTSNTDDLGLLDNRVAISNNKIYYFKSGKTSNLNLEEHQGYFGEIEIEAFDQYQVEFKNDKAVETKVATCAGYQEGAIE